MLRVRLRCALDDGQFDWLGLINLAGNGDGDSRDREFAGPRRCDLVHEADRLVHRDIHDRDTGADRWPGKAQSLHAGNRRLRTAVRTVDRNGKRDRLAERDSTLVNRGSDRHVGHGRHREKK